MLSGTRGWAAIGSYPKGCSHVRRHVGAMRAELERVVLDFAGSLSVYQAALIQSACRHEGRALLLTRWLRVEMDGARKSAADADTPPAGLTVSERLAILKEVGNATDSRDRCIKALGLVEAPKRDPWDAIDNPPTRPLSAAEPATSSPPSDWREHPPGSGHEISTSGGGPDHADQTQEEASQPGHTGLGHPVEAGPATLATRSQGASSGPSGGSGDHGGQVTSADASQPADPEPEAAE